ncbi:MAG: hypothetical protein JWM57_2721, partial [Phycisphaerales bacterium]|nr:hypothetical protein [Phycisphaerales bacterium]
AARRVKCLSNMRQIVMAMNMFAQDNKGLMPSRGAGLFYVNTSGGISAGGSQDQAKTQSNWISWTRNIDPVSGASPGNGIGTPADQNITWSGLAKYLGSAKPVIHTTGQGANDASPQLESLFRCPSDLLNGRYNEATGGNVYRYSYSMNDNYATSNKNSGAGQGFNAGLVPAAKYPGGVVITDVTARSDGRFNGRIGSIKNTSDKILLYCQDSTGVDDGCFQPNPYNEVSAGVGGGGQMDLLSSKHDDGNRLVTKSRVGGNTTVPNDMSVRGDVVMADGHGEFMTRRDSLRQIHSGNPYLDPDGW